MADSPQPPDEPLADAEIESLFAAALADDAEHGPDTDAGRVLAHEHGLEEDVQDALARRLHDEDPRVRQLAAELLRECVAHADDLTRSRVRGAFVMALVAEADTRTLVCLLAAVRELGAIEAKERLLGLADHDSDDVRYALAEALATTYYVSVDEDVLEALVSLTRDADVDVRFSAVHELGVLYEHGHVLPRIEAVLRAHVDDPDEGIGATAREALDGDGAAAAGDGD